MIFINNQKTMLMKRRFLFLLMASLISTASFAQGWTKPEINESMFASEFIPSQDGDSTIYYLYNVESKAFFTQGNAPGHSKWATNAVLSDAGNPVMVYKYLTADEEGNMVWDNKSYVIKNYYAAKTKWFDIFIDGILNVMIDRNAQANYMWEFEPQGNGVYYIKSADVNPDYNVAKLSVELGEEYTQLYLGFDEIDDDYLNSGIMPLSPGVPVDEVALAYHVPHVKWAFIPAETYQDYKVQLEFYQLAESLGDLITQTIEEYPEIDTTPYLAVYNNTASSAEELQAAIDKLKVERREREVYHALDGASEDNPKDATILLVNPSFENINADGTYKEKEPNVPGWIHEVEKYTNNRTSTAGHRYPYRGQDLPADYDGPIMSHFLEIWRKAADVNKDANEYPLGESGGTIHQVIKDLPAGKYSFTCNAMACCQIYGLEDGGFYKNPVDNVFLYAKGGTVETKQKIATEENFPEHFNITFVHSGGDIELGVRFDHTCATWVCLDEFTLTYYGEITGDPEKIALWAAINDAESTYPDMEEVYANTEVKEQFQTALDEAKEASDNFQQYREALATARTALQKSVNDYKAFKSYIQECEKVMNEYGDNPEYEPLTGELGDMLMEWEEAYNDGTATSEEIAGYKGVVQKKLLDFKITLVKVGDITDLLVFNPNFDYSKGISGWTVNNVVDGDLNNGTGQGRNLLHLDDLGELGENGTLYSNVLKEMNKTFELSQTLENMPAGCYTFTLNAFERNGDIDNALNLFLEAGGKGAGDTAGSLAYIFANDEQTLFNNLWAGAQDEVVWATDKGTDDGVTITTQDVTRDAYPGKYIPDTTTSANFFFNLWNAYFTSVSVYLPEQGTLKFGIKKDKAGDSFMVMDNMRLYYNGNEVSSFEGAINDMIARLSNVLPTDGTAFGNDASEKVAASIAELQAAKGGDEVTACATALANAKEVLAYAQGSVKAYKAIQDNSETLYANMEQYVETATPSVYEQATALVDIALDALSSKNLGNEEAEALAAKIAGIAALLKVENFDGASSETPADMSAMIVNATFDTVGDFTGWQGTAFGAGGDTSTCAEMYNKTYDTYQDILGLPAGYYTLKVQGFYRRGEINIENEIEAVNPDSALNAILYAYTPNDTVQTNVQSISTGAVAQAIGGGTTVQANAGLVPNSMVSAVDWMDAGYYTGNEVAIELKEGDALRIGVKKTVAITNDWSIFDNFQLIYTGTDKPVVGIEEIVTSDKLAGTGVYDLTGRMIADSLDSLDNYKGIVISGGKKKLIIR